MLFGGRGCCLGAGGIVWGLWALFGGEGHCLCVCAHVIMVTVGGMFVFICVFAFVFVSSWLLGPGCSHRGY